MRWMDINEIDGQFAKGDRILALYNDRPDPRRGPFPRLLVFELLDSPGDNWRCCDSIYSDMVMIDDCSGWLPEEAVAKFLAGEILDDSDGIPVCAECMQEPCQCSSLITPPSEGVEQRSALIERLVKRAAIEGDLDFQIGPSAETLSLYQSGGEPDPSAALAEALEKVKFTLDHTLYWYSCRFERLSQFMREEATLEIRHRYFNIMANGTADSMEPPTYAQQMNMLKHKAERLAGALKGLLDEPCRYDHNGFCQEHYCSKPCKHEVARAALAIHRKATT